ncbi:MAG: hypothetical protein ACRDN0_20120 [Trebonia sp.]
MIEEAVPHEDATPHNEPVPVACRRRDPRGGAGSTTPWSMHFQVDDVGWTG